MMNRKLKQATFLLNAKQLSLYNLLSDRSKHDLSPGSAHRRAIPFTREGGGGERKTHALPCFPDVTASILKHNYGTD